ncbi:TetR/AcrR family transcriptional regulator [Dyadobacter fanqingshengii]|uniref:TetR/AcrR family transcriptional regulator n=1 Tax=Dyadobacter fanqingshengii TaxID=2906443 RepID=A0A9X1PB60_9BACT|nr:TetR/AcrR family transcriptional regulator [Dyadobacter fanqingshengii]MCF0041934.1 TetR/AcrR family transcriptional regulator [Dyadobacter fanqingshengii]MCF2504825.1 TetR/AcrR family transcriptional regulator [Dyadobacter fanqingshengii]USJ36360.1 TetR/AcrR family transcriptional regulator [Dyadobacter fanqingshengii]
MRTNILSVALQLVKDEGWQSLSIRKIADAIEYSVPVIYDHFENKEAILFELSMDGFRLLERTLEKNKRKYPNPEQLLKAHAEAYWTFAFKNPEYYQLMYGLGMPCSGAGKIKPEFNVFRDYIGQAIEKIVKEKKSTDNETCFKIYAFWSVLHGLISIVMMRCSDIDDSTMNKKVMDDTVEAFIKNL